MKYSIIVSRNVPGVFTYQFDQKLNIGQLVSVDFHNKGELGIVQDEEGSDFSGKIKKIKSILPYIIPEPYIKFANFVAEYNLVQLGSVFKLIIPFSIEALLFSEKKSKNAAPLNAEEITLNPEQSNAVAEITSYISEFKPILLHGVTGSGKTEVFLEVAKRILDKVNSSQILILVPEIALSLGTSKKVSERLGCEVFIWHNTVSPAIKRKVWKKAISGEKIIVVGARSALFIPFFNLKLIVIDEEHDSSFKQNEQLIYNARDMAVYLGYCLNIPVILSSATPSIESYNNAILGKYIYIKLENKYHQTNTVPDIKLMDLRKEQSNEILTEAAVREIKNCLKEKKQSLIYLNRRGHTPKILCKSCGEKLFCPGCSTWLCYHAISNEYICHHCGFKTTPKAFCPKCGEKSLIGIGAGIEKVCEECQIKFPDARIAMLSSDIINTNKKILQVVESIQKREVDIIIGTQIISKGHNFSGLDLVVIPVFDSMLYGEDFRLTEHTFQMLYQVSGRAGRSADSNAKILIQTYNPDEYLIKIFQKNNIEAFYRNELNNRKLLEMPPFSKMAVINLSSLSEIELKNFANQILYSAPKNKYIRILGAIQPALYKLKSRYRLKIIFISSRSLQPYLSNLISKLKIPRSIKISLDIDPYDFY